MGRDDGGEARCIMSHTRCVKSHIFAVSPRSSLQAERQRGRRRALELCACPLAKFSVLTQDPPKTPQFAPNVERWRVTDLSMTKTEVRTLRWSNPLQRSETFKLGSDGGKRVVFCEEEVSLCPGPDSACLSVAFSPPPRGSGGGRENVTLSLTPSGGGETWFIRVAAEWVS
jgi:hypothetical protein